MTAWPSVEGKLSGTCLVVHVSGAMDYQTARFFREGLLDELVRSQGYVVLDLSGVPFCDSAGLNVLLGAWRKASEAGSVVVLACVPVSLQRMLSMTGVDSILQVYATVADAEGGLAGAGRA
ncbi:STAS domain-containing protein [Streptomyces sp. NPDC046979]|uniref:STAS domain-containing protein n=1 Tax=Streptomyces sp. NPDC046979 TaxID=3154604 RepID=UPI0033F0A2C2